MEQAAVIDGRLARLQNKMDKMTDSSTESYDDINMLIDIFEEDEQMLDKELADTILEKIIIADEKIESHLTGGLVFSERISDDEIKLLVKYNTEKSVQNKSWAKKCSLCQNQKFGDLIVSYMKKIRETEHNDADVLIDLTYFFGYLYWQSRVWTMENPVRNNNNGRNCRNNQHRTNTQRDQRSSNPYGKPKP